MMTPIRPSYSSHLPHSAAAFAPQDPYQVSQQQQQQQYHAYADHVGALGRPSSSVVVHRFLQQDHLEATDGPARRRRASKPKVKTGCVTCKIRHVKCDEAKPACKRCTSTGRKCDGYDPPSQGHGAGRQPVPLAQPGQLRQPTALSLSFQGTVQERETFQRFQDLTVPALNGGSETTFWQSLVLRVGIQEPVIRQAIIALTTLHDDYRQRGGRHDKGLIWKPNYQRALELYGGALRQLNARLAADPNGDSGKLAIIASILFTCFEVLRRNDMTAIVHYRAGMRELMRQMNVRRSGPVSLEPTETSQHALIKQIPQDELDTLLRVFARYDVQACTFAKPQVERLTLEPPVLPTHNLTVKEVRHHLDNLIIAAYQTFPVETYRYWPVANVPVEWRTHVLQQLDMFERWRDSLESFFRTSAVQLAPAEAKSLLGLRMQIRVAIIQLKTSFNCGPEGTFDAYRSEFEEMVTSVERVTQSLALKDADPLDAESTPFTMELGVVHPLFFIAWKCRDHRLRKRAIAQLRKAGKEGVWDGPVMAVLAKRMMQIEERNLISGQTVPECNRIHNVRKEIDYEGRRILAEMTLALDDSWERFEKLREPIPF